VADAAFLEQEAEFYALADSRPDRLAENLLDPVAVVGMDLPEGVGVRLDLVP
jgi:hypothetical protein